MRAFGKLPSRYIGPNARKWDSFVLSSRARESAVEAIADGLGDANFDPASPSSGLQAGVAAVAYNVAL